MKRLPGFWRTGLSIADRLQRIVEVVRGMTIMQANDVLTAFEQTLRNLEKEDDAWTSEN